MKRTSEHVSVVDHDEEEGEGLDDALGGGASAGGDKRRKCPYLDTVNRQLLDFDSEKLCSVTLTNRNVYVCLACGKYFEGRGKATPAYTHSLQCGHYVYMSVESGRSYCLPDSYEIFDSSLQDIQRCLSPSYSLEEIARLSTNASMARDVHGMSYLPGFIGLNNLAKTDDLNVVLLALSHVAPLRDFFLQSQFYSMKCSPLVRDFGLVVRKLWSSKNFKSTVSPQELVHHVALESKRKFSVGSRAEAIELFIWILNSLKRGLGAPLSKTKDNQSAVFEPFQGVVEVESLSRRLVDNYSEQLMLEKVQRERGVSEQKDSGESAEDGWVRKVQDVNFNFLSLEIPPCPLFRDSHGGLVIPQVPLYQLLQKFDGSTWTDQMTKDAHVRRQYRIKKLPRFLVLHLVRFTKNNFTLEKNPTIVTFPVRNLEMKDFLHPSGGQGMDVDASVPTIDQLAEQSVEELVALIKSLGAELHQLEMQHALASTQTGSAAQRAQLLLVAQRVVERVQLFYSTKYDLVANICHESNSSNGKGVDVGDINTPVFTGKVKPKSATGALAEDVQALENGAYKVHLQCKAADQWYELQDLHVNDATPQQIGVSESYILVYEKKNTLSKEN